MRAIILDLDGVVIDSEALHVKSEKRLFSEYGVIVEPEDWPEFKGLPPRAVFEFVRSKYDLNEKLEVFLKKKDAYLAEAYEKELQLFPDFPPFIERFRRDFIFALTTSTQRPLTEFVLTKFQLEDIFQVVITSDDVTNGKPDPEPYVKTIGALGVKSSECVVIEDSFNGIQAAKRAGVKCIAVATSFGREKLIGADVVVNRLGDVRNHLISSLT